MTRRLVRVLQRGGVTARIRPDVWGIWRATDRRRRCVGSLLGREIELMKLNEQLKPLGALSPAVWVWNFDARVRAEQAVFQANRFAAPALLHHLILNSSSERQSQEISYAAKLFRRDHAQARIGLSRTRDAMLVEDQAFLQALVLTEASKSQLAKAYGLRPDAVETKALSVLRELAKIYA